MGKALRQSLMNSAYWTRMEPQSHTANCDWSVESHNRVAVPKDLARYQDLVSHWKDLILKATGHTSGY